MMRRIALTTALTTALSAALICAAPAQAQAPLGRLFSTPEERAAMEAARGSAAALLPNSQGVAPTPGMPGGPAPVMGGAMGGTMGGSMGETMGGAAAGATPPTPQAPPSAVTMTGVLRSSDNRSTVWLNGVPQPGLQNQLSRKRGSPDLTVTLPSGKKIILKPGQRYDLNENRIKDVNEP